MNGIVWDVVYVNRIGRDGYGSGYGSVVGDVVVNINEGVERFENGVGKRRRENQVDACVRREPFVCRARPLFCLWVVLTIQVNEGWCGGGIGGVYLVVEPRPVFIVFDISRV